MASPATRITVEHKDPWLVVTIERRRIRHLYLTPDDAELLARMLLRELPELTVAKLTGRRAG